jgi:hypothetical protein
MAEPVLYQGVWWFRHPNGALSWFDAARQEWVLYERPASTRGFERVDGLATWTVRAVVFDAIVSGIGFVFALQQFFSIDPGQQTDFEGFTGSGIFLMNQLTGAMTYVSGILFFMWFYRSYQNVTALNARGRYAEGWAIGGWLVPILSLFRPKQIANDIWRTSDPTLPAHPGTAWMQSTVHPLLNWWWGVWVVAGAVGLVAFPIVLLALASNAGSEDTDVTDFLRSLAIVFATSYAGRIVAAFFAVPVVKRMTERQRARAAQLGVLSPD